MTFELLVTCSRNAFFPYSWFWQDECWWFQISFIFNQIQPNAPWQCFSTKTTSKSDYLKDKKKQKPISQIFGNFILTGMCIYFLILSNDFKKTDHAVGISRITDRRGMLNYVYHDKGSKQNGKKDSLF